MLSQRYIALKDASRFERTYAALASRRLDIVIFIVAGMALGVLLRVTSDGISNLASAIISGTAMFLMGLVIDRDIKKRSTIMRIPRKLYKRWHDRLKAAGYTGNLKKADRFLEEQFIENFERVVRPRGIGFSEIDAGDSTLDNLAGQLVSPSE